ncbi:hypothetical protein ALQ33_05492, partial [Pseudomonas syringae pv. philadelphi]
MTSPPETFAAWSNPMIFNTKDFGALGDGITDDTAAIQATIDAAAAAGGGEVVLGAGTYIVS